MSSRQNQGIGDIVAFVLTDGATPPVILASLGVNAQTATPAGVVRNAKGDYTVNFPLSQCDALSRWCGLTATSAANIVQQNAGTDSSQGVLVFDAAAAAADGGFSMMLIRTKSP